MKRVNLKPLIVVLLVILFLFSAQFASARIYRVPDDYLTIQDAIDDPMVKDGDTIIVGRGSHAGAIVTKAVRIMGRGGAVIDSGPLPLQDRPEPVKSFMAGFFFTGGGTGSGTKISHLRFEVVEFPVYSRGADNVTVSHCTMINPIQGISNWGGSRWSIMNNRIIDLRTWNGGGIGILLGDKDFGSIMYNLVTNNKIKGTLYVDPDDGGDYNGTGIVLYADFRWGRLGSEQMAFNWVFSNKVSLTSDTPEVVDVCAIELTDTRDDPLADPYPVIYSNLIAFNDLRGTELKIVLTPEDLINHNYIFGNRGVTNCFAF